MDLIAGLDVGTTGCKVTVYDPGGECLGRLWRGYPVSRTAGAHEVDAEAIWDAVQQVLAEAAAKWPAEPAAPEPAEPAAPGPAEPAAKRSGIGAIGVTSFGESFVLLGADDRPLRPVMLYTDPRAQAECDELCAAVGAGELARLTGVKPHPMYSAPKLMWVKRHEPGVFAQVRRIALIADFVVYRLTGVRQIDHALATRTMLFDVHRLAWDQRLLDTAGVDAALLPAPVPMGARAGPVMPAVARRLGLRAGVQVVSAGQDQTAAAVGSGVLDDGDAVDGAGTVECITPVFSHPPAGDALVEGGYALLEGGYAVVPYVEGRYVCYAFSFAGGAAVSWFTDNFAGYAAAEAETAGVTVFDRLGANGTRDEPTGLLVLPHFAGAATPYMDYGSRGAILGCTLSTTQADVFAGIMEGVCFEMRLNLDHLARAGLHVGRLRATGGGANSRLWMQLKADILGVPVAAMSSPEAGGLGAAMLAGVATGAWPGLREAAARMVREREVFRPRASVRARYDEVYARYENLYRAVRPLMPT